MTRPDQPHQDAATIGMTIAIVTVPDGGPSPDAVSGVDLLDSLSDRLGLSRYTSPELIPDGVNWILRFVKGRLSLIERAAGGAGPTYVDFTPDSGLVAPGRREPLAVAGGVRAGCETVVDATAGFGKDAFMLALLGMRVTACERNPVIAALLDDGLRRARICGFPKTEEAAGRVRLEPVDALTFLSSIDASLGGHRATPDVVYIDPMYLPRRRKVAVNKKMRISRLLAGNDDDSDRLMPPAMRCARRRVVVKRHPAAEPLLDGVSHRHEGKTARYDVYVTDNS